MAYPEQFLGPEMQNLPEDINDFLPDEAWQAGTYDGGRRVADHLQTYYLERLAFWGGNSGKARTDLVNRLDFLFDLFNETPAGSGFGE